MGGSYSLTSQPGAAPAVLPGTRAGSLPIGVIVCGRVPRCNDFDVMGDSWPAVPSEKPEGQAVSRLLAACIFPHNRPQSTNIRSWGTFKKKMFMERRTPT